VIGILKENEVGAKFDDLCRRHGISSTMFYAWRKKFGGMEISDAKKLPELGTRPNARLKRIVADQMLGRVAKVVEMGGGWTPHPSASGNRVGVDGL